MAKSETVLRAFLAALLFPGLLFLLVVLGWGVFTEPHVFTRLALAAVFSFLSACGLLATRIFLHSPNAALKRLSRHPPGTLEFLAAGFKYLRSRSTTLKLSAGFALLLGILHIVLPFVSDLSLLDLVVTALITLVFPLVALRLLFRTEAAALRLLRRVRHFSPHDQQRALLFLAKGRSNRDEVAARITAELEELGVEAIWPEADPRSAAAPGVAVGIENP